LTAATGTRTVPHRSMGRFCQAAGALHKSNRD
jgi:hypothetical protein